MSKDLTNGGVLKNLLQFSLPFLLSYFLQALYGLADLFIVGQFHGADAIAAVSVGSQVMHMVTAVVVGLSMGSAVLLGRAVGAQDTRSLSRTTGSTIFLFLCVAATLTPLLPLFCPHIVSAMKVPPESAAQTRSYLLVCFAGFPFIVAYNVIAAVFRGTGDSKSPLAFIAFSCALNIALDYLLVGAAQLDATGAAAATVIAQLSSVVISLGATRAKKLVALSPSDLRPDLSVIKGIAKIGVPVAAQDGFIQVSFLLITAIANERGVVTAAAVGIVEKTIGFLFLVPSSMLSSVSAVAAQNIGAGKQENASKALFCGAAVAFGIGLLVALSLQLAAEPLLSLFTDDTEVLHLGAGYIRSYVFDCAFGGIQFSFSGFFCACGKSMYAFAHNVVSIIAVRIPGAYAAVRLFPDTLFPLGLAATLGSLLSSLICVFFYLRVRRSMMPGRRANGA